MTKRLHVVGAGLLVFAVLFISPVVNAQCRHFAYNPFLNGGKGGMDCVSISIAAGTDGVTGAAALDTANRVPIVAGVGELGQSDLSLASGVFSRAGNLGLSATGANSVTLSTNGSTRLTVNSAGVSTFAERLNASASVSENVIANYVNSASDGYGIKIQGGTSGSGRYALRIARYDDTHLLDVLGNGNLLVGTTTDYGSRATISGTSITSAQGLLANANFGVAALRGDDLTVGDLVGLDFTATGYAVPLARIAAQYTASGSWLRFATSNAYGTGLTTIAGNVTENGNWLIGTSTDGNYRLDVAASGSSGTVRFWDQTGGTGVTAEVVRAGAAQSTTPLTTWQNNAGTTVASMDGSGELRLASGSGNGLTILDSGGADGVRFYTAGTSNNDLLINQVNASYISILTNNTERMRIGASGSISINGDTLILATAKTPSSASDTCTTGQEAWDADYQYRCVATNTWKRVAIATWP